jgi:hypothetical protein
MNRFPRAIVAVVGLLALVVPATGDAHDDRHLRTRLSGFNEVHAPALPPTGFTAGVGAIFSTGSGRIKLTIDKLNREIAYELSYTFPDAAETPVVGAQFVNQAHLHFGQKHTTGGIPVWLCKSPDNQPLDTAVAAATPTCPSPNGTVSGTIHPAQVLALTAQGFPAGMDGFDALLEAIEKGAIYANVHTDRFPPGEIRGQLDDHDHHD